MYSIVEKKLKLFDDVTLPLKKEKGKFETKDVKIATISKTIAEMNWLS